MVAAAFASASVQVVLLLSVAAVASAQLSATFYDASCPRALATIRSAVTAAVRREPRMGASLLRLHFHDCFVQGCDGSVLLADTANLMGEQGSFPNRGFDVVDSIKARVEAICPRTVSCADILAVAARDSTATLGGPPYTVLLGRRDYTTASLNLAISDLPPPGSSLASLVSAFARKGLSATDIWLHFLGSDERAHTIGQAQCTNFRSRFYGESNLNAADAASLRVTCPQSGGDGNLAAMDLATPNEFDAAFFRGLLSRRGVLHSDQQLFSGGATDALVRTYASNAGQFRADFAAAMVRLGSIGALTGNQGHLLQGELMIRALLPGAHEKH